MRIFEDEVLKTLCKDLKKVTNEMIEYIVENDIKVPLNNDKDFEFFIENDLKTSEFIKMKRNFFEIRDKIFQHCFTIGYSTKEFDLLISSIKL